jgi:hypothetical protein
VVPLILLQRGPESSTGMVIAALLPLVAVIAHSTRGALVQSCGATSAGLQLSQVLAARSLPLGIARSQHRLGTAATAAQFDRRACVTAAVAAMWCTSDVAPVAAFVAGEDEEVSGLVVLRVAEVCAFQEKLLRTIAACSSRRSGQEGPSDQFGNAYCDGDTYGVNPAQILFGTGVMLKNANLDGNLKLMIRTEVPDRQKEASIKEAVNIMNTFSTLVETAGKYQTFESKDLILIADIYSEARQRLVRFFDFLPVEAKDKFYNYADEVRRYEEKVSKDDGIDRMKL